MTTKAKLDAACAAAKPLVDAAINQAEGHVPIFAQKQAAQAVEQHRAEIDAGVRKILDAGIDAADKVPA
jgi:hypothetical protein